GVPPTIPKAWKFDVRQGSFWPPGDPSRALQLAVLGPKLKRELFGEANALGQFVRIGGTRFRVIGIMASKGQFLGFDIDDGAYVPVANALKLVNPSVLNAIGITHSDAGSPGP